MSALGHKGKVTALIWDVCFTPQSGHYSDIAPCPLCAKSGHSSDANPLKNARSNSVMLPSSDVDGKEQTPWITFSVSPMSLDGRQRRSTLGQRRRTVMFQRAFRVPS